MSMPKSSFTDYYSQYLPRAYMKDIVGGLRYELPFLAGSSLKPYIQAFLFSTPIRTTIVGSGHGLDACVLHFGITREEILERWTSEELFSRPFETSNSNYEISMVDLEAEPLRFATDVNLCTKTFQADLCREYPEELIEHFRSGTDLVLAFGVTSYMGPEGFERLIETAFERGGAKLLGFSVLSFLDVGCFVDVCEQHGLIVRRIATDLFQRIFADDDEKTRIHDLLRQRGELKRGHEQGLLCHCFLAYRRSLQSSAVSGRGPSPRSLIVVGDDGQLIGSTVEANTRAVPDLPHPWHIAISPEQAQLTAVREALSRLRMTGALQPSDIFTTPYMDEYRE